MANEATRSEVDEMLHLPDADFAREFGVPVSPESEGDEGKDVAAEEVEQEQEQETEQVEDAGEEPETEGEAEPETESEGEPEPEPARKTEKKADFRAFDDDGEYDLEALTGVKIEYKANGKTFAEPIDKVVRLAQMGRLNQARLDEAQASTEVAKTAREEAERWRAEFEKQRDFNIQLLEDEDAYVEYRTDYSKRMTPEARLERAEAALAETKQREVMTRRQTEVQQFMKQDVEPEVMRLLKTYPEVSEEELYGVFSIVSAPWMGPDGMRPDKWSDLRAALAGGTIEQRIRERHESRVKKADTTATPLKRQAEKAQEEATKAKRTLARAVKAPGAGSPGARSQQKSTDTVKMSAEQAADSIINDILANKPW